MAGRAPTSEHARRAATQIVHALREHGHVATFAGGCVRDELLGLAPSDYDVATDATPDRVRRIFPHSDLVGACFGVVLVKLRIEGDPVVVEVATFRADGPYSDSRRPDAVTFSTQIEDAKRRDFTVNALYLDPDGSTSTIAGRKIRGRVIDLVGGIPDIESRTLRAVGDADTRLAEDHLRALRAVRLAAKLGFTIEPATAEAIRRNASHLRGVSRERIGDEIRRMLAHPTRSRAAEFLRDLGLERPVLDAAGAGAAGLKPDRYGPGLILSRLDPETPPMLALGAWAIDLGIPLLQAPVDAFIRGCRAALCLSNDERQELHSTLHGLRQLCDPAFWIGLTVARRKRFAAGPQFPGGMALLRAIDGPRASSIASDVDALALTFGGLAPDPLVTGDDLVEAGWSPGPAFKRVLDTVYDAQLEGVIVSQAQGMELARGLGVYK
ncbi:MAG: CCA tRNA nucleotidyltransferase [Phycisphaeraceae bacterium]|nr:CCA tRNA nucleotidyltransferase [Phycisphaeraceae bacterium]